MGGWLGANALPAPLWIAAFSAAAVTAGGNALNDLWDLEIDRVNHPDRPLPSAVFPPAPPASNAYPSWRSALGLSLFSAA